MNLFLSLFCAFATSLACPSPSSKSTTMKAPNIRSALKPVAVAPSPTPTQSKAITLRASITDYGTECENGCGQIDPLTGNCVSGSVIQPVCNDSFDEGDIPEECERASENCWPNACALAVSPPIRNYLKRCPDCESYIETTCPLYHVFDAATCRCILFPSPDADMSSPCVNHTEKTAPSLSQSTSTYYSFANERYTKAMTCSGGMTFDSNVCKCSAASCNVASVLPDAGADYCTPPNAATSLRRYGSKTAGRESTIYQLNTTTCRALTRINCPAGQKFDISSAVCGCACPAPPREANTLLNCTFPVNRRLRAPSMNSDTSFFERISVCNWNSTIQNCPPQQLFMSSKCGCGCPSGPTTGSPPPSCCELDYNSTAVCTDLMGRKLAAAMTGGANVYYLLDSTGTSCAPLSRQVCGTDMSFDASAGVCGCVCPAPMPEYYDTEAGSCNYNGAANGVQTYGDKTNLTAFYRQSKTGCSYIPANCPANTVFSVVPQCNCSCPSNFVRRSSCCERDKFDGALICTHLLTGQIRMAAKSATLRNVYYNLDANASCTTSSWQQCPTGTIFNMEACECCSSRIMADSMGICSPPDSTPEVPIIRVISKTANSYYNVNPLSGSRCPVAPRLSCSLPQFFDADVCACATDATTATTTTSTTTSTTTPGSGCLQEVNFTASHTICSSDGVYRAQSWSDAAVYYDLASADSCEGSIRQTCSSGFFFALADCACRTLWQHPNNYLIPYAVMALQMCNGVGRKPYAPRSAVEVDYMLEYLGSLDPADVSFVNAFWLDAFYPGQAIPELAIAYEYTEAYPLPLNQWIYGADFDYGTIRAVDFTIFSDHLIYNATDHMLTNYSCTGANCPWCLAYKNGFIIVDSCTKLNARALCYGPVAGPLDDEDYDWRLTAGKVSSKIAASQQCIEEFGTSAVLAMMPTSDRIFSFHSFWVKNRVDENEYAFIGAQYSPSDWEWYWDNYGYLYQPPPSLLFLSLDYANQTMPKADYDTYGCLYAHIVWVNDVCSHSSGATFRAACEVPTGNK